MARGMNLKVSTLGQSSTWWRKGGERRLPASTIEHTMVDRVWESCGEGIDLRLCRVRRELESGEERGSLLHHVGVIQPEPFRHTTTCTGQDIPVGRGRVVAKGPASVKDGKATLDTRVCIATKLGLYLSHRKAPLTSSSAKYNSSVG
jgi:hypothetical protein